MVDWITPGDFVPPPQAPVADILREPGEQVGLGLPRGFVAAGNGLPCDDSVSAFVRGILLDTVVYNSMSQDQRLSLQDPNRYPLWRLYSGPHSTKDLAAQWSSFMFFWAFNNNKTWISHGEICVAPPWAVAWPADQSMQWNWVYENSFGKIANRYWNGSKNVIQVVG
jgi:hypothetical protein